MSILRESRFRIAKGRDPLQRESIFTDKRERQQTMHAETPCDSTDKPAYIGLFNVNVIGKQATRGTSNSALINRSSLVARTILPDYCRDRSNTCSFGCPSRDAGQYLSSSWDDFGGGNRQSGALMPINYVPVARVPYGGSPPAASLMPLPTLTGRSFINKATSGDGASRISYRFPSVIRSVDR